MLVWIIIIFNSKYVHIHVNNIFFKTNISKYYVKMLMKNYYLNRSGSPWSSRKIHQVRTNTVTVKYKNDLIYSSVTKGKSNNCSTLFSPPLACYVTLFIPFCYVKGRRGPSKTIRVCNNRILTLNQYWLI